jgi:hypothetical protein
MSLHEVSGAKAMVRAEKLNGALYAINGILIIARLMAYENDRHERIAELLDIAELLPMLLRDSKDNTEFFRELLVGCSEQFPKTTLALQRFDGGF